MPRDIARLLFSPKPYGGSVTKASNAPSVGKTSFALALARNLLFAKCPVFFVSLEQGRAELAERLLSAEASIDSARLRRPSRMLPQEWIDLVSARDGLRSERMWIADQPAQSVASISANTRRYRLREKIGVVMIDYLQLIDPENRRIPRHEQVGAITHRLKGLARELGIPVVLLAQLNRGTEARSDARPKLADIRESGDVEQDADVVVLLHNPTPPVGSSLRPWERILAIEVAKNRNGPTGIICLRHDRSRMRFHPWDTTPNAFGSSGEIVE